MMGTHPIYVAMESFLFGKAVQAYMYVVFPSQGGG